MAKFPRKSKRATKSGGSKKSRKPTVAAADVPARRKSLVEFFRESPLVGVEIDLERDRSPARDVDLFSKD